MTRFLAERGEPQLLLTFVQQARHKGHADALRGVYRFANFDELETAWRRFVLEADVSQTTAAAIAAPQPPTKSPEENTTCR